MKIGLKNDVMKDEYVVLSMTTIPIRECIFEQAINSILNQSYKFDKLVINIDDEELFEKYSKYKNYDSRIEINFCDKKWKSCNKLIPTLQKYPDAVIITVDDDIKYPVDCIKKMVEKHKLFPTYIISMEDEVIFLDDKNKKVSFESFIYNAKLEQAYFCKYLSNCCLFPSHTFDDTEIFNFDDMIFSTLGVHDELWFWINSALKGIKSISLNYVFTLDDESIKNDTFKLSYLNCHTNFIHNRQVENLNYKYGERLYNVISKEFPEFYINNDNAYLHCSLNDYVRKLYPKGCKIHISDDVTATYRKRIEELYNY